MIRGGDRVAKVLERDESLVEVFAGIAPAFERLRKPAMRRVMARLVTVDQAARMAGVDPELLLRRLNEAVGEPAAEALVAEEAAPDDADAPAAAMPAALAEIPAEMVIDVDVREDLRAGREPFSRIMQARQRLRPGSALRLRAIFEPVPLYAVMEKQGLSHWTERLAEDDWRVWFYAPAEESADLPETHGEHPAMELGGEDGNVVVLDVRGLEPPEPMVRTLAALEALPQGGTLVQINVRAPQFLLPKLEPLGFTYEVREQGPDLVRVFIRRRND